MNCDCPLGTCKEFGFTGRRADICAGRVLTPEACEAYRKRWRTMRLPPLTEQAISAISANVRWIAAGRPKRSAEEREAILAICQGCEFLKGSRCALCGCWLARKTKMATEHCPMEKW